MNFKSLSSKFINLEWVKFITLIIALGGFILGTLNYFGNKETSKFNKDLILKQYAPKLVITNIIKGTTNVDFPGIVDSILAVNITIKTYLTVKNESNYTCNLIGLFITDTVTNEKILRDIILLKFTNTNSHIKTFNNFTKLTFLPHDSTILPVEWTLLKTQRDEKKEWTHLHILFVYQNEFDGIYDTYYIQKLVLNRKTFEYVFFTPGIEKKDLAILVGSDTNELLKIPISEKEYDYYIYNSDEIEIVKKFYGVNKLPNFSH